MSDSQDDRLCELGVWWTRTPLEIVGEKHDKRTIVLQLVRPNDTNLNSHLSSYIPSSGLPLRPVPNPNAKYQ